MKRFGPLFLLLWLSYSAWGQKVLTEVDLRVNGIGSGTPYSKIIKTIGNPLRAEKHGNDGDYDNCADGWRKTLYYRGLEIGVLSDAKGRNYKVISLEVTSSKWKISPGIRIGLDKQLVRSKFGKPNGATVPGENVLNYVTKENLGGVTFYFKGNKLVRVEMEETLC